MEVHSGIEHLHISLWIQIWNQGLIWLSGFCLSIYIERGIDFQNVNKGSGFPKGLWWLFVIKTTFSAYQHTSAMETY